MDLRKRINDAVALTQAIYKPPISLCKQERPTFFPKEWPSPYKALGTRNGDSRD